MPKQTKTTAETHTESLNATDDVAACAPQSERRRMHPTKAELPDKPDPWAIVTGYGKQKPDPPLASVHLANPECDRLYP